MNELTTVEDWIHDALAAQSTLTSLVSNRIWAYAAKQSTETPYVIYQLQGARDTQGLGTVRLITSPLYLVRLVFKGFPNSAIDAALNAIDAAIGAVSVAVQGGLVISGRRETPIAYLERDADQKPIFHRGGLYRLEVSVA